MDLKEVDIALDELEQRIERLRSLYEQYFLGIEKIEPTIPRKDVERRLWLLRRVKVRNTQRRFRMQLLVQRYNTFQQYWIRICRQIENGTYSRHLRKAEATFGKEALTIAAQRRRSAEARMAEAHAARSQRSQTLAAQQPPTETDGPPSGRRPPSLQGQPDDPEIDLAFERISLPPPAPGEAPLVPPAESIQNKPTTRLPAIPGGARPTGMPPIPGEQPQRVITPAEKAALGRHALRAHTPAAPRTPAATQPSLQPGPRGAEGRSLSEQRMRELHAQLNAEKKRLADPTGVSYDSLAKSLQDTANKLRAVHGSGKKVDFRVVVKGGKAMVKPVLR